LKLFLPIPGIHLFKWLVESGDKIDLYFFRSAPETVYRTEGSFDLRSSDPFHVGIGHNIITGQPSEIGKDLGFHGIGKTKLIKADPVSGGVLHPYIMVTKEYPLIPGPYDLIFVA